MIMAEGAVFPPDLLLWPDGTSKSNDSVFINIFQVFMPILSLKFIQRGERTPLDTRRWSRCVVQPLAVEAHCMEPQKIFFRAC